jgi:uncharacterized membrane protein YhaH (DUF805 family)
MSPLNYIKALISPAGRLDPVSFAFLSIVLAIGHLYVFAQISYQGTGLAWNPYTISLFVMLWMQFCILTRRSKDTGSSGAIYLPVFLLAFVLFLIAIDPEGIWPDIEESGMGGYVTEYGVKFMRALYVALFIYGIRAPGMDGENAYGPEFGELRDEDARARADKRRGVKAGGGKGEQVTVRAKAPKGFKPRQRPAGFGRR